MKISQILLYYNYYMYLNDALHSDLSGIVHSGDRLLPVRVDIWFSLLKGHVFWALSCTLKSLHVFS